MKQLAKCTCGYDARNNERDLDVNCSIHMAARAAEQGQQLFTDKTDEYDMRDKQPTQPPAVDVLERMYEAFDDEGGTGNYRKGMAAALAIAREGYVSLANVANLFVRIDALCADLLDSLDTEEFSDTRKGIEAIQVALRARPVTDEQKVEAILSKHADPRAGGFSEMKDIAAEIVAALRDKK
jgi:hypothetical protein